MVAMEIAIDDPTRADVALLLAEHLADMRATSPPESVHALDVDALTAPAVTFWSARRDGVVVGVLRHLVDAARGRGYTRLSLETGSQPFFARGL